MHFIMFLIALASSIFLFINNHVTEGVVVLLFSFLILGLIAGIYLIEKKKQALKDIYTGVYNELGFQRDYQKLHKGLEAGKITELYLMKLTVQSEHTDLIKPIGTLLNERFSFDTKAYFNNGVFGVLFVNLSGIIVKEMKNQVETWLNEMFKQKEVTIKYEITYFEVNKTMTYESVLEKIKED